ncbi:glycosyltransferase family 4 protein [Leptospira jelokensis]|uniref:Glycosyltransferase n=1 Tax=Leptospira jelokensis TaxID=2484931 RepID=A0A4Z1AAM3_9LEPT|nr:glycosyltransferase family 4 protein [Leptospira jelokensis]TGL74956.1 glycosyltransferase [Leptospira jelokensis]
MAKILFITPRFLQNASGGAEKLATDYVNILKETHDVTVCTSTAKNYVSWKNEFKPGQIEENNFKIIRFPVEQSRNINKMNSILDRCLKAGDSVSMKDQMSFLIEQGPFCPKLVEFVSKHQFDYDLIVLIGYLYYPVVLSIPLLKVPFVIVPTFHDEPPFRLPIYRQTYLSHYFYSFNAPEELEVYESIHRQKVNRYFLIGTYLDDPNSKLDTSNFESDESEMSFQLLTIGRIEPAKGYPTLFEYFQQWKQLNHRTDVTLKCLGSVFSMDISKEKEILFSGFVSEEKKVLEIQNSYLLLNPSAYESFSISIMESWLQEKPVLVNGMSSVMKGHCIRSQGGLYYSDSISFQRMLEYLLENKTIAKRMGKNGRKYVLSNFSKDIIKSKLNQMVNTLLG